MKSNFFHSAFDFFTHAVPGSLLITVFLIIPDDITNYDNALLIYKEISIGEAVVIVSIGYLLGFAIYPIGRFLTKKNKYITRQSKFKDNLNLHVSEKYVLVRQYSPANFKYIEIWNMYSAMSHNLAVVTILSSFLFLYKLIFQNLANYEFWIFTFFISIILSILFFRRSISFSIWATDDLNASIKRLNLLRKDRP